MGQVTMQGGNAGAALIGGCGGLICAMTFGVVVGAVILRAAISLYNRLASGSGTAVQPRYDQPTGDYDQSFGTPDPSNPFAAPQYQASATVVRQIVVPEPDFGKACLIVFVSILINGVIGFVMGSIAGLAGAAGGNGDGLSNPLVLLAQLIQLPIGFLVTSGVLTGMLPTTFGRACLVALLQYAISLIIAIVIGGIVFSVVGLLAMA